VIDFARGIYSGIQAKAGLGPFQSPIEIGRLVEEVQNAWGELRPMVEWACALLRQSAVPMPFEREWFLASVQLFRDFGDADVRPVIGAGVQREYGQAPGHLGHSHARFAGEPWFRLIVAERQTNQLAGVIRARRELSEPEYDKIEWLRTNRDLQSAAKDRSVEYAYLADLRRARQDLLPLAAAPTVRARVHLNLGGIALSFSQRDLARRHFDEVAPSTPNRCLAYLGHLLRGRVDELTGSPKEAERSFRAALNLVPRAQSATLALGALLWLDDRQAEATAIVEDAFSGSSVADDPWTAFQKGGHCTEWHQFIANLRVGLHR
jgi:tetratricopeptide (TPR) repeat protein